MSSAHPLMIVVYASLLCAAGCIAQGNDVPPAVQVAIADLAGRLNTEVGEIKIVSVEEVTWPDASLGHPQPGMVYAQVLVPGYKVILEARGTRHEYHTDRTRRAVYVGEVAAAEVEQPAGVTAAIKDLAARLQIAPGDVEVVSMERVEWPDSALGWREPGMMYTQAVVPGYRVILGAGGRQFEYHATAEHAGKLGGMYFDPETTSPAVFAMQPIARQDANNFFDLHLIDPVGDRDDCVVEAIADFAPTLDGRDLLVIRRVSRSDHDLLLVNAEGDEQSIARAFAFPCLSWSPLGERFAYWRPQLGEGYPSELTVCRPVGDPQVVELPVAEDARIGVGALVWTLDGLVISARTRPEEAYKTFFWDGEQVSKVGDFEVLAWIPHTSSVVARRVEEGGAMSLLAVHLPQGQQTPLMSAPKIVSAAPLPAQSVVLAVIEDDTGRASLVSVTFSGEVRELLDLNWPVVKALRASPLGDVCTVDRTVRDTPEALLIEVGETAETAEIFRRFTNCSKAVPVRLYASP